MIKKNCRYCGWWWNRNSTRKGVRIPDGTGKCTRPEGHCDPDVVKGKIGEGAIVRREPVFVDTGRGNCLLQGAGFFISYNPCPCWPFDFFASDDYSPETALVKENPGGKKSYYILNGDYRGEYAKLFPQGFDVCLSFYRRMQADGHGSSWSID